MREAARGAACNAKMAPKFHPLGRCSATTRSRLCVMHVLKQTRTSKTQGTQSKQHREHGQQNPNTNTSNAEGATTTNKEYTPNNINNIEQQTWNILQTTQLQTTRATWTKHLIKHIQQTPNSQAPSTNTKQRNDNEHKKQSQTTTTTNTKTTHTT